jgi:hypothetical protein
VIARTNVWAMHPFKKKNLIHLVDDQKYLLGCMCLYLVELFLIPNIFGYVGSHFLGIYDFFKNPHWKAIKACAWLSTLA